MIQNSAPYRLITAFLVSILMAFQYALPVQSAGSSLRKGVVAPAPMFIPDVPVPVYVWVKPDVQPKGIVLTLHGGAMHGRSFNLLGKFLADKDYCVVSLDMRGYGVPFHEKTPEVRKFNYKKSLADIYEIIGHMRSEYPDAPVICLGESLGANVALYIGGDSPDLIDGIIAISPFAAPQFFLYPQMNAHLVQFLLNPLGRLDMSIYLKRRLAHDRERSRIHLQDPLARNKLSVPELIQTAFFNLKGKKYSRNIPHYLPVLFVVGQYDRLCSHKATFRMFHQIPSEDKKLILVGNQGHLMVETDKIRGEVAATLVEWLDDHQGLTSRVAQRS